MMNGSKSLLTPKSVEVLSHADDSKINNQTSGGTTGGSFWMERCPPGSLLDETGIRIALITLYVCVLAMCLFGNSLLILVICLQKSMRSSTNFFLGNLAVADLLVGVFCVVQNCCHILVFKRGEWPLGGELCRIYVFILHLVPSTSAGILVLLSVERYVVVLHPMSARKLLSPRFLGCATATVWTLSFLSNVPFYVTAKYFRRFSSCGRDFESVLNIKWLYTSNFLLWYCFPLVCLAFMYSRIAVHLWKSTKKGGVAYDSIRRASSYSACVSYPFFVFCPGACCTSAAGWKRLQLLEPSVPSQFSFVCQPSHKRRRGSGGDLGGGRGRPRSQSEFQRANNGARHYPRAAILDGDGTVLDNHNSSSPYQRRKSQLLQHFKLRKGVKRNDDCSPPPPNPLLKVPPMKYRSQSVLLENELQNPKSLLKKLQLRNMMAGAGAGARASRSNSFHCAAAMHILESRKRVVRLLLAVIASFSLLTLPNHVRLLSTVWIPDIKICPSSPVTLLQPVAFLLLFVQSGINPLLYAFLSRRFRDAVWTSVKCYFSSTASNLDDIVDDNKHANKFSGDNNNHHHLAVIHLKPNDSGHCGHRGLNDRSGGQKLTAMMTQRQRYNSCQNLDVPRMLKPNLRTKKSDSESVC